MALYNILKENKNNLVFFISVSMTWVVPSNCHSVPYTVKQWYNIVKQELKFRRTHKVKKEKNVVAG